MSNSSAMVLNEMTKGSHGVLQSIAAGRYLTQRLATMGFFIGAHFKVLDNSCRGRMILMIGRTRLALGAGITSKLLVCERASCMRNDCVERTAGLN